MAVGQLLIEDLKVRSANENNTNNAVVY